MNKETIRILGIMGAHRKNGRTSPLLQEVLNGVKSEDVKITSIDLLDFFPHKEPNPFFFSGRKDIPESIEQFHRHVLNADALVWATPTTWWRSGSLTHYMIEWLTPLEEHNFELTNKGLAAISVCEEDGGIEAATNVIMALNHMGCFIIPFGSFTRNIHVLERSEGQWMIVDPPKIGKNLVSFTRAIKPHAPEIWNS